jgi:hypothetical protein
VGKDNAAWTRRNWSLVSVKSDHGGGAQIAGGSGACRIRVADGIRPELWVDSLRLRIQVRYRHLARETPLPHCPPIVLLAAKWPKELLWGRALSQLFILANFNSSHLYHWRRCVAEARRNPEQNIHLETLCSDFR